MPPHGVVAAVAMLLVTGSLLASGQDRFRLDSLTVPPRLLPADCRLAPDVAKGNPSFVMYPTLRQNPWSGTGPHALSVRAVVDGPLDRPAGPEGRAALAAGLVEAYRARYLAGDGSDVDVYAVSFTEPALTLPASITRLGGRPGRTVVIGNTAAWVSPGTGGGECYRAVLSHIESLLPDRPATALDPARGVVLSESAGAVLWRPKLCNRAMPWPIEGTWVPEPSVIARLELRLGPALDAAIGREPPGRFPKPEPRAFFRQCLGFIAGGRRIVYINGAHERIVRAARNPSDWKTTAWNGCDGGLSTFGAEYDPATDTIHHLTFNGGGRGVRGVNLERWREATGRSRSRVEA